MNKKYIEEHDTQLERLNDRKAVNEDLVEGSSRQEERTPRKVGVKLLDHSGECSLPVCRSKDA